MESRTDDYCGALFKKLDFIIAFCKEHGVKNLIHGGDLLDNPNISDLVAGKIAKKLGKSGLKVWYVIGNHDITGKNPETYVNGKLHMFESYPWFNFIGGKVTEFDNCLLTGRNYNYEEENDIDVHIKEFDEVVKPRILVLHSMIFGEEKDFLVGTKRIVTSYRSMNVNADLVLCGHYHPGFGIKRLEVLNNSVVFVNPGSFSRTDRLINRTGIGPGLAYIRIGSDKKIRVRCVKIPCDRSVFVDGEDGKYELADIRGAKFFECLQRFQEFRLAKNDIGMMLKSMAAAGESSMPFKMDENLIGFIVNKVREVERGHKKDKG